MSLPNFEYVTPKTVEEALSFASHYGATGKMMAGGTDLLVRMKDGEVFPHCIIDLKRIPGLNYIRFDKEEGLRIGALTTLRSMEASPAIKTGFPVLARAAHCVGSVQVRNRGTIGGNICNASPCADMVPALIGLGAKLRIKGRDTDRVVKLEEFFQGSGETVLQPAEIVTEIGVPNMRLHTGAAYCKFGRRKAVDISVAGVAVVLRLDAVPGKCMEAGIVLGAVAPVPMRAKRAEEVLLGRSLDNSLLEQAADAAAGECIPRSSTEYKREWVKVITKRALREALKLSEIA